MLLERDNEEIAALLGSSESLLAEVDAAMSILNSSPCTPPLHPRATSDTTPVSALRSQYEHIVGHDDRDSPHSANQAHHTSSFDHEKM